MNNSFQELHQAVTNDRKYSVWSQQKNLAERVTFLQEEVQELIEAIEKEDLQNIKEELGDVMWVTMALVALAEEKKMFTVQEMFSATLAKIKQRKPWIFMGQKVSLEEEVKRWKEIKQKRQK